MRALESLGARIYAVAALTALILALLGGLLLQSTSSSQKAFGWVGHTQRVIATIDRLEANLGQAESGLRGYLLAHDESYLERFDANLKQATDLSGSLRTLAADNPLQHPRALRLADLAAQKTDVMAKAAARNRAAGPKGASNPAARERGRALMNEIEQLAAEMRREEQRLLSVRTAAVESEARDARRLLLYGFPVLALLIAGIGWLIRSSISRPLANLLDAVNRFGAGDREARADTNVSSDELRRLALAYNGMAESLGRVMAQQTQAEDELARANAELIGRGAALEARQRSVQLMSEMSHRLQAIQNDGELSEVLDCFLPQVLPDLAGALYVHNHSRNMLMRLSVWGDPQAQPEMFAPSSCWGLRRGQAHAVVKPGADLICTHADGQFAVERLCEPVLAGGEVLGLLYVEGPVEDEYRFRLSMLMENVALALVNENLRSRLREQSIRDPLTKLFNRRYMEEALALETARAERAGTPLSIVMADVDHFKRFNDSHGHEAGDALLAKVAEALQAHFRHGDIVCRYGGEEFTVIAPGASSTLIHKRVEALRLAVREMTIDYAGQRLGPVTMSFGVDTWTEGQEGQTGRLVGEADRALFRAKRLGRDRIEFATHAEFVQAAE